MIQSSSLYEREKLSSATLGLEHWEYSAAAPLFFFFRFLKHWEYFAKLVDTKGRDICEGSKSWSDKSLRKIGHMVFKMFLSTRLKNFKLGAKIVA